MTRRAVQPGDDVGGYRVVARLGSGANGSVYRAVDGAGAPVAVKVLHGGTADDEAARARLAREAATLHRLDHTAVADVLDVELDGEEPFIVTELVEGRSLEDDVALGGPYDAARLADLAAALRDALDAVHAAGVVHRDVKPSNVMCSPRGPVLVDFGIAHGLEDARLTSDGLVMGTPGYLAPEMLTGTAPSAATDWWGWAASLAFAATGRAPFGVTPVDAVLARAQTGSADLRGLGPARQRAISGALTPDPAARWSPDTVVDALRAAARDGDEPAALGANDAISTAVLGGDGYPTQVVGAAALTGAVNDGHTRTLPATPAVAPAAAGWGPPPAEPYEDDDLDDLGVGVVENEGGDGGSGYLRPDHRARPWLGTALAAPFATASVTWPLVTTGVLAAVLLLARYVGVASESLHGRRERRGVGRSDGVRVALVSPWHLVRAVLGVLPALLVGGCAGVLVVVLGWWALARTVVVHDGAGGNAAWVYSVVLGVAGLLVVLLAWLGPAARLSRFGARTTFAHLVPARGWAAVVGVVALLAAAGLLVPALHGHEIVWWPLSGGPDL